MYDYTAWDFWVPPHQKPEFIHRALRELAELDEHVIQTKEGFPHSRILDDPGEEHDEYYYERKTNAPSSAPIPF